MDICSNGTSQPLQSNNRTYLTSSLQQHISVKLKSECQDSPNMGTKEKWSSVNRRSGEDPPPAWNQRVRANTLTGYWGYFIKIQHICVATAKEPERLGERNDPSSHRRESHITKTEQDGSNTSDLPWLDWSLFIWCGRIKLRNARLCRPPACCQLQSATSEDFSQRSWHANVYQSQTSCAE